MTEQPTKNIPFSDAIKVWIRVAVNSFGGPAGQIAVMHRILVEEKKWISENRFLHALNYCMLLPGPEAQQLATYIGWLLHKTKGGTVAGSLFILPGFVSILILILSIFYAEFKHVAMIQGLFYGIKPAIMAIVVHSMLNIGRRALNSNLMVLILAFVALYFLKIPFPLIIIAAGFVGFFSEKISSTHPHVTDEPIQSNDILSNDPHLVKKSSLPASIKTLIRPYSKR